jgi:hypothetical protein
LEDGDVDGEDVDEGELAFPEDYLIPPGNPGGYDSPTEDANDAPLNETQLAEEPLNIVVEHETAGRAYGDVPNYDSTELHANPWAPFKSADDFQQADRFVQAATPKTHINSHFNEGGCKNPQDYSYSSGKTLWDQIDRMEERLPGWKLRRIGNNEDGFRSLYYRPLLECAKYLLRQRCFKDKMAYAPMLETTNDGHRVYHEMNTAECWEQAPAKIPEGDMVVVLVCSTDETMLTSYSGDKKSWPLYLTLGNIHSTIRNRPSSSDFICVALMPVPPKISSTNCTESEQENLRNIK